MNVDLFGNLIVEEESYEPKVNKTNPFTFSSDIGDKNRPETFLGYNAFLMNASFSQRKDTVIYANEMNKYHQLGDREQFDFYYYSLPKKKYFAKWAKAVKSDYTDSIIWYFKVSYKVAKQYEKVLKKEQMDTIKVKYDNHKGGRS